MSGCYAKLEPMNYKQSWKMAHATRQGRTACYAVDGAKGVMFYVTASGLGRQSVKGTGLCMACMLKMSTCYTALQSWL